MFNLCILQAGPINKKIISVYPSYDMMFASLLEFKKRKWNAEIFDIFENKFPTDLKKFDGFIITGSAFGVYDKHPWIKQLFKIIKKIADTEIPLVGICFGHQAIAEALGGKVEKSDKGWGIGVSEIFFEGNKAWLTDIDKLKLIFFHQDQVVKLPPNAELIAGNKFCNIASFSIKETIFTLQGHPEFSIDFSLKLLEARKNDLDFQIYSNAKDQFKKNQHEGLNISNSIIKFLEKKTKF